MMTGHLKISEMAIMRISNTYDLLKIYKMENEYYLFMTKEVFVLIKICCFLILVLYNIYDLK